MSKGYNDLMVSNAWPKTQIYNDELGPRICIEFNDPKMSEIE